MGTGADIITILGIAVGLAMDAFSVCLAAGLVISEPTRRHYFRLSFHFGLFQFMMPVIGYFAGSFVETLIRNYDHWVALALVFCQRVTTTSIVLYRERHTTDSREEFAWISILMPNCVLRPHLTAICSSPLMGTFDRAQASQ